MVKSINTAKNTNSYTCLNGSVGDTINGNTNNCFLKTHFLFFTHIPFATTTTTILPPATVNKYMDCMTLFIDFGACEYENSRAVTDTSTSATQMTMY